MIIEDDHFSARRLKRLIMDIDDTIDVHGPLKSVAEVTEELAANNDYDLIFSDIRLADGDVFEAFRKVMPQSFVIFTTAYDEYAMEAINTIVCFYTQRLLIRNCKNVLRSSNIFF